MRVRATGDYPNSTPVEDVHEYQNNGTATIDPARYVERAESAAGEWSSQKEKAVADFLTGGGDSALLALGNRIAKDVGRTCDRIRTGQLKSSFEAEVDDGS